MNKEKTKKEVVQDNKTREISGTNKYSFTSLFDGCGEIDCLENGIMNAMEKGKIDPIASLRVEHDGDTGSYFMPWVSISDLVQKFREQQAECYKYCPVNLDEFNKLLKVGDEWKESYKKLCSIGSIPLVNPLKEQMAKFAEVQAASSKSWKELVMPGYLDKTTNIAPLGDAVLKVDEPQLPAKKEEKSLAVVCKENCDKVIDELCDKDIETSKPAKLTITGEYDFYKGNRHFVQTVTLTSTLVEIVGKNDGQVCGEPSKYKLDGMAYAKKHNQKSISTIYGDDLQKVSERVEEERHFHWKKKNELIAQGCHNYKQKTLKVGLLRDSEQWIKNDKMTFEAFYDMMEDDDFTPQDFSDAWKKYNFTGNTERILS